MAKLKQSKNREEILEREKENAIKEGVTTKERIKGNLRVVQTQAILFLKSMSQRVGSDIQRR